MNSNVEPFDTLLFTDLFFLSYFSLFVKILNMENSAFKYSVLTS